MKICQTLGICIMHWCKNKKQKQSKKKQKKEAEEGGRETRQQAAPAPARGVAQIIRFYLRAACSLGCLSQKHDHHIFIGDMLFLFLNVLMFFPFRKGAGFLQSFTSLATLLLERPKRKILNRGSKYIFALGRYMKQAPTTTPYVVLPIR